MALLSKLLKFFCFLLSLTCRTNSQFYCSSSTPCIINCNENKECNNAFIYCTSGYDCTINCEAKSACSSATIYCPTNAMCTINCGTISSNNDICKDSTILALDSQLLIINLGGGGGDKQMKEANIQCPNDGMYDASTPNISLYACQISIASSTLESLSGATITAVEGLHDVNINCDDTSTCIDTSTSTTIKCTADGSSSCELSSYNTCGTTTDGTADCQTYVLTSPPTVSCNYP